MAQLGQMFGGGARLGVADFGHRPDPVAQGDETRLDRINATPNVTAVVHRPVPDQCESEIVISFARPRLALAGAPRKRLPASEAEFQFSGSDDNSAR